jgi:hypothetical protein
VNRSTLVTSGREPTGVVKLIDVLFGHALLPSLVWKMLERQLGPQSAPCRLSCVGSCATEIDLQQRAERDSSRVARDLDLAVPGLLRTDFFVSRVGLRAN